MVKSGITKVKLGSSTDTGNERSHNEDSLSWLDPVDDPDVLSRKGRLYVVADGMGGYAAGEVASKIAVETIVAAYDRDTGSADADTDVVAVLMQAIQAANAEINQRAKSTAMHGMGTTVVCAVVRGDCLYVAYAGDSRAYLFRDNTLQALTSDHSLVNEQIRQGILTLEEAQLSEQRNIITRALGIQPEVVPDFIGPLTLKAGDNVLLCTDGVCGYVSDEQIQFGLQTNPRDPQAVADFLIQAANAAGGYDNATALVVWVEEVVPIPPPVPAPVDAPAPAPRDAHTSHLPMLLAIGLLVLLTGLSIGIIWGVGTSLTLGLPVLIDLRARQLPPTPASFARQAADLFRGTPLPSTPEALAIVPTVTPAPAVQWVTCTLSLQPAPPLTLTDQLLVVPVAVVAGRTAEVTVLLQTDATIMEPLTLTNEVDLTGEGVTFQLWLEPQVNFNRDEQVKIAVSVIGPAAEKPARDQAVGTLVLPPRPSLPAHSKLVTLLSLRSEDAAQSGGTKVRLTVQWVSAGTIPGEFKTGISP